MGCVQSNNVEKKSSLKEQLKQKIHDSRKSAAEIRVKTLEKQNTSKHSLNLQQSKNYDQIGSNIELKLNEQEGNIFKNYTIMDQRFEGCLNPLINFAIVNHNLTQAIFYLRILPWDCLIKPAIIQYIQKTQLNHPNLQSIYEIFSDPKSYFLIQDYCSGNTLSSQLKEHGPFSESKCILIMNQMLNLIQYLHSQNLCHGQLVLDSFMFLDESPNLIVKLVDLEPLFCRSIRKENEEVYYYSPEFCKTKQKTKSNDIWAIGMIGYELVTKYHPLKSVSNPQQVMKNLIRGGIELECTDFERLSEPGKVFFRKILQYEPKRRLTIQQALEMSWIQSKMQLRLQESMKQLQKIKTNQKKVNNIQACVLLLMVNLFNSQQKQFFATIFNNFDNNKDQKISFDELKEAFKQLYPNDNSEEIIQLFKSLDIDKNGYLEFHEFIIASVDKSSLLTNQHLQTTFKIIDKNKSGKVSVDEIQKICTIDFETIKFSFEHSTKDHSVNMTFNDFKELMLSLL